MENEGNLYLGTEPVGALMRRYHTADALFAALSDETKKDELTAIDGIGETLAAILQGATFTNAFRALREHIVPTVYEPPAESGEKTATGKSRKATR